MDILVKITENYDGSSLILNNLCASIIKIYCELLDEEKVVNLSLIHI